MQGIGDAIASALASALILAFVAGAVSILGIWALWHFVLSHVRLEWIA